ncbi:MAG: PQQ-dependent sugar dehydrogenase [Bacteroidales bacterium]|nr:PQQ-dependent sugar dehydrogenase [Bacteroidales bacterium]
MPNIMRFARLGLLACVAGLVGLWDWGTGREPATPQRIAWTTSRVIGSPESPPPFRAANAFPHLKFDHPVHLTAMPGADRLVVCEERGKIYSFPNRPDTQQADLFFDPARDLQTLKRTPGATGFDRNYALAFHPQFQQNRYCFVVYTLNGRNARKGQRGFVDGTRVSRFRVTETQPPRLDPASETIILTFLRDGHNGCDLQFGPDGYLYICLGDAADPNPPDILRTGQDISDLHSSVLRIDVDHPEAGKPYAIPTDNPFVGMTVRGKPARGEVWAYGFRNPWRMSFDRQTGDLWLGDVGWESWEMIHKVEKGGNYGWSIVEARQSVHADEPPGPTPIRPPMIELPHTQAASVTGGFVYRGKKLPQLFGAYIFGDWETRRLWAARFADGRLQKLEELISPVVRSVGFGEDAAGELYFVAHDSGLVHTLEPNTTPEYDPAAFPRTLSATGLFSSTTRNTFAPGVYPFVINSHQWQDHATAEYGIALPNLTAVRDYEKKRPIPGNVFWHNFRLHFPQNTVLVKTLSLEREQGNAATQQRIETQLLHFDGSYWHGYTYAWRDDQTDADLVPADGADRLLTVTDSRYAGGKRQQMWTFLSRSQCLQCHNAWNEYALAFNLTQVHKDAETPMGRRNQLEWLNAFGLLERRNAEDQPIGGYSYLERCVMPRLADPNDMTQERDARARSYLHVNCSSCHRFGGGGSANIDLTAFEKHRAMNDLTGPAKLGKFDLPDPHVIAPGEPYRSVLYYRMAKFNSGRMPHIGSTLVDPHGTRLIHDWIQAMKPKSSESPPTGTLAQQLERPGSALALAHALTRPECPAPFRQTVLAAAEKLAPGPVRDLFDGYLPQDPTRRKLGPSPRPRAILTLSGDAARGRELLHSKRVQCLNCHQQEQKGTELGPKLDGLAKTRRKEELLESLLDPSRRVEPPYQAYQLLTLDGKSFVGLLVKRNNHEIILKDHQNKTIVVQADNVDEFRPARESLMPTGQLADLTAQEAADLLEWLMSLR